MVNADLMEDWKVDYDAITLSNDKCQEAIEDWTSYLEEQAMKKDSLARAGLSGEQYAETCQLIDSGKAFDATLSLT
jgi:hypothetical protein